jgi:hypothetical protein
VRNSSNEAPTQRGWEISFELPLFDWGGARVARAEAYRRPCTGGRDRHQRPLGGARGLRPPTARLRHRAPPPRRDRAAAQAIAEENLLRYNGMLIGVFELLADARAQIASVNAAIDAKRDFWLAQADLDMALIGKPSLTPLGCAHNGHRRPAAGGDAAH